MKKKIFYILCVLGFGQYTCSAQTIGDYGSNPGAILQPAFYSQISAQLPSFKADSFSLRLWASSMYVRRLITFRKHGDQWEAHKYSYFNAAGLTETGIKPKISLPVLVDSLRKINFDNLISQYEVKGFKDDVEDGIVYTLEITTPNSYKVVQYRSPEAYPEINNKRFFDIIWLLNKYFKFYAGK